MAGMSEHDPVLPPGTGPELAGRLLVATPELGEGPFERSVVLLLDHDENGALASGCHEGRTSDTSTSVGRLMTTPSAPGVLFQGGPVALDSALGLALVPTVDDDEEPLGWRRVVGRLGLVDLDTPPELLAAELTDLRIFAGYAGWAGGQLEDELEEGAWYVVPASADGAFADAFTTEPDRLWRDVLRRQGGDLAMVSTYLADPSLN